MNDDIISLSDESYYHGSAVIMGDPSYLKVIVENSYDVPFWLDFLTGIVADKHLDITPFDNTGEHLDLTMGKAHIYRMSDEGKLGPHLLGCVDADYDYLLGSRTVDGRTLQAAKYIVHTFAYSVENLLCCHKGFSQICTQAVKSQPQCPFGQWMNELAEAVYPLLLWALYLDSRDDAHDLFSATSWAKVFPHTGSYVQSSQAPQEITDEVRRIAGELVAEIETKVTTEDIEKKNRLEEELVATKALTPQNSLMYVRGHDLYSFVSDVMLKPVCRKEKNSHLAVIDANAGSEEEKKNLRNQYIHQCGDPVVYLDSNYSYKNAWPMIYDGMKALYHRTQP